MDWKAHKILNRLYMEGESPSIANVPSEFDHLIQMGRIQVLEKGKYRKGKDYDSTYERKYLGEFQLFYGLLSALEMADVLDFPAVDLHNLIRLKENASELLAQEGLTLKHVSSKYFNTSKQIKKESNLQKAISKILPDLITDSSNAQYLYVLNSAEPPKAIVLCENFDQLNRPRRQNIELWYAGGNNTAKLAFVPAPVLPLYYLCDWDYAGLTIYSRIKTRYFPSIQLIEPERPVLKSIEGTKHHAWRGNLNLGLFSSNQCRLIGELIELGMWIEEESLGGKIELRFEESA